MKGISPVQMESPVFRRFQYRIIPAIAVSIVPFALFATGAGKLFTWSSFRDSLDTFVLVPDWILSIASMTTPAAELVPLMLLLAGHRLAANCGCLFLLCTFSAIVAWHLHHNVQPACGCLGVWAQYANINESSRSVLVRNLVLAVISVIACVLSARQPRASVRV